MNETLKVPRIQQLQSFSSEFGVYIDVLRLDEIHPIVSGNKWYKLKYYLEDAKQQQKDTIVTFGGAYSNHILATAFACKHYGFKSIGIIRGEETTILSSTLKQAKSFGMDLHFVGRKEYLYKEKLVEQFEQAYIIAEGGEGVLGIKGASTILDQVKIKKYNYIACAIGTGTMISGLLKATNRNQQCIGVNVLKGFEAVERKIIYQIADDSVTNRLKIFNEYHFGGYAKHPTALIEFMNYLWQREEMPTDIVYTSKLFYAVHDLLKQNHFESKSNILIIHSGGLQGNSSLAQGRLLF
ncbi:MAG: pyridoxal-phosphate dependent enzyme [Chitinophagaceae bacterium]|nr:pyridoxal-phosphate dependent enzyme [Chitinophagaceae bacterium]